MSTSQARITLCGKHLDGPLHICAFFNSRDEQYDILLPYLKEGVEQGNYLITITDPANKADHLERLRDFGIDPAALGARGHTLDVTADDTYVKGGEFSASDMYDIIEGAVEGATQNGFTGLRGFGEMHWALKGLPGTEDLIAYESRVNYFNPRLLTVCVYDVNQIKARVMADVLATHPKVIMDGRLHENPYYIHPDEYLSSKLHRKARELRGQ